MTTETVILTQLAIERCESLANSYTRDTLAAFGVAWPPIEGWKRALIGREISRSNYERAFQGRSKKAKLAHPLPEDWQEELF